MRILGIETSCDETAAAVVVDGTQVVSSVVSSQVDSARALWRRRARGGESGARRDAHAGRRAGSWSRRAWRGADIDAVAATVGPGLIGSLLVGVSAAKSLSLVWDVPFVAVNHLEAHLYAAFLEEPTMELPLVVILVSGGHTMLVSMEGHGQYRLLGQTLDDAAGEAFDKVARFLDLGYPGGPLIDRLAIDGDPSAIAFPGRCSTTGSTSRSRVSRRRSSITCASIPMSSAADVAASFQQAVVDVLVTKARRAAHQIGAPRHLPRRRSGRELATCVCACSMCARKIHCTRSSRVGRCAPTTRR